MPNPDVQRAWSVFEVKEIDDDKRVIEGIATTPKPDRVGDIVEPDGAEFKLPIPLLWQHNAREPIGEVFEAKVSKSGIRIKARVLKIDEPGRLKERLDEAWQSIKYKLVRGLSIGFKSLEDTLIQDTFSFHFLRWEWLELSPVTIPANVESTIQTIKQYDMLSFRATRGHVVKVNPPGASGTSTSTRSATVKTIKERIKEFEATRAAKAAEMEGIQENASKEGRTKDEQERERFDTLHDEVKAIDRELRDLHDMDELNLSKATAVSAQAGVDPGVAAATRSPGSTHVQVIPTKLPPGIKFARMAMAIARAKDTGLGLTPEEYYRADKRWMDTAPEVAMALKAAVPAGDSTTSTWASEWAYAQNIASEFVEFLRPKTLIGRIQGWRRVPFNIRVGSQTGGSTGYWVGQGAPIPASQLTSGSASLGITKVAGLVSITKELARLSTPAAEGRVRDDLTAELQKVMDRDLIDPNNGGDTNVKPAALTYGVTPVTPTGTDYDALKADWKSLTSAAISAELAMSGAVLVMSETTAQSLSLMETSLGNRRFPDLSMTGGTMFGLPVFTTTLATISGSPQYSNIIVLIFPMEVFLADDGMAEVQASDQVSIQLLNNPTNQSTGATAPTTVVSMFQTESIAIKAVRDVNWTKARTSACAWIQAAAYV